MKLRGKHKREVGKRNNAEIIKKKKR